MSLPNNIIGMIKRTNIVYHSDGYVDLAGLVIHKELTAGFAFSFPKRDGVFVTNDENLIFKQYTVGALLVYDGPGPMTDQIWGSSTEHFKIIGMESTLPYALTEEAYFQNSTLYDYGNLECSDMQQMFDYYNLVSSFIRSNFMKEQ